MVQCHHRLSHTLRLDCDWELSRDYAIIERTAALSQAANATRHMGLGTIIMDNYRYTQCITETATTHVFV